MEEFFSQQLVTWSVGKKNSLFQLPIIGQNITIKYTFLLQTLVWKTFAKIQGVSFEDLPVVIENVKFHRATIMPKEGQFTI